MRTFGPELLADWTISFGFVNTVLCDPRFRNVPLASRRYRFESQGIRKSFRRLPVALKVPLMFGQTLAGKLTAEGGLQAGANRQIMPQAI